MKDFQFIQKHLHVDADGTDSMVITSQECLYMDKKVLFIKGTLADISIVVRCGNSQIDLTKFTTTLCIPDDSASGTHYCYIPFPVDQIVVTAAGSRDAVDVSYYGGSA